MGIGSDGRFQALWNVVQHTSSLATSHFPSYLWGLTGCRMSCKLWQTRELAGVDSQSAGRGSRSPTRWGCAPLGMQVGRDPQARQYHFAYRTYQADPQLLVAVRACDEMGELHAWLKQLGVDGRLAALVQQAGVGKVGGCMTPRGTTRAGKGSAPERQGAALRVL
jgi:hypothetical protein